MTRRRVLASLLAVGLAAAGLAAALHKQKQGVRPLASVAEAATATARVQARTLVDRQDLDGRLQYAGGRTVAAAAAGTITRLRAEGATVRRGRSLYSVDAVAAGYVLYGRVPPYRDLAAGVARGRDVEQLERNLAALGYDPGEVDTSWTAATTAAVRAWEADRGSRVDGVLSRGEVVVVAGAARVGAHRARVGDAVRPGAPVTELTSRRRVVTARLPAGRQSGVDRGDAVKVTLPNGREVRGRVRTVGRVARAGADGAEATVGLEVRLGGRAARR
ncbi:MAG TPA: peptidoglycan-binding domain-containing protein, partial [Solirubrobacteraceae bacterium]